MTCDDAGKKWANRLYLNWTSDDTPVIVFAGDPAVFPELEREFGGRPYQNTGRRKNERWQWLGTEAVQLAKRLYNCFDAKRRRYADVYVQEG